MQLARISHAAPAGLDESDRGGFQSVQRLAHHFRANRSAQGFSRISIKYKRHGRDYNGKAKTVDCLLNTPNKSHVGHDHISLTRVNKLI